MKTKTNKRVLAWVLSICMAIALLPAMPVEYAQASEGDLVFNFDDGLTENETKYVGEAVVVTNASSGVELSEFSDFGKTLQSTTTTTANGSDPWVLADVYTDNNKNAVAGLRKGYGLSLYTWTRSATRIVQLGAKLTVGQGQEGWYEVKANIYKGLADVAEVTCKMELHDGESASDPLKLSYTNGDKAAYFASQNMGTAYFDAGDYYFLMSLKSVERTGAKSNDSFHLKDITFEKVDFSIAPSETSATVAEGESTDITLALKQAGVAYSGNVTYSAVAGLSEDVVANTTVSGNTLTVTGANAGKVDVTVTATVDGNTAATLTIPVTVTAPAPEEHPTFGTSYAYIREDFDGEKTTYKLILIAAVDSLNYTKVGFNYTIGDDTTVKSTEETAAYKTLTFNGASRTADDLGGSADGYLFYSEIELTAAQAVSGVEFKAYADEEVGGTYSIDTAYYTAQ